MLFSNEREILLATVSRKECALLSFFRHDRKTPEALMETALDFLSLLFATSPQVLALILGLAAIGLAGFAIWVVHAAHDRQNGRR